MPRPTFYLIDGHAHIYRAYFAPFRDLTSPDGEPTKATFVFTQMLLNLAQQRRPDYLAMVIDHGDETVFRKSIYPEYKANRPPRPADFGPQEQRILQLVRQAGVPIFEAPGFEADDILATFAARLQEDFDVFLVSKDKDLRQLLNDRVRMYDVQADAVIDPDALRARLGYGPEQSVEVQTLIGDATDNVPGIPGVGEKTAAQLLADFGTIEGIYSNLDKLKSKKKLVENLIANRDLLKLSRELVTLRRDVPIDLPVERCRHTGFDVDSLAPQLTALGFRSLVERLKSTVTTQAPRRTIAEPPSLFSSPATTSSAPVMTETKTSKDLVYTLIDSADAFEKFVTELKSQRRFAFDTETDSQHPTQANIVGLSFSWKPETGVYVAVRGPMGARVLDESLVLSKLKPILEDETIQKIGHNIKYDQLVMRRAGVHLRGVAGDTMIAGFILDASQNSFGIDAMALRSINFKKIPTSELIGTGKNQTTMDCVDTTTVGHYASEDVDVCWRLDGQMLPRLQATQSLLKLYDTLEVPLIDVLAELEWNGIRVDPAILREQSNVLADRIEVLRRQIFEASGTTFNPDSPKQLADVLFEKLKLPTQKKTKTGFSTDVEVLEKLALDHAVPKLILEYRSLMKLKGTYLDNLPGDINPRTGRIHTSFHMTGAATGRLSSSDPNLQNIPIRTDEGRRIRRAFVADAGNSLVVADYSQIELRVLAHFTREPALMKAFENDEDIHAAVASEVFGVAPADVSKEMRSQAKVINFGIIYGITAVGLSRRIDGMTVPRADELIRAYNKRFPGIEKFMRECVEQARSTGYVETILGRRRPLPDIHSGVINIRNMNERMAINSVVQGSAADLIKLAMLNLHRRMIRESLPARMLLQVHDELVFETADAYAPTLADIVQSEMTCAMKLAVPLKVEVGIGKNWDDAK
jgi:DNA polymerase I